MSAQRWASLVAVLSLALSSLGGCVPQPAATPTPQPTVAASTPTSVPTVVAVAPTATPALVATATPTPQSPPTATATATATAMPTPTPRASRGAGFAAYRAPAVAGTPRVKPYSVAPDLSNVGIHKDVVLSAEARALLARNAFVVTPGDDREFFHLYERLSYDRVPAFITTDSVLHVYHLLFDKVLRETERENLAPALASLTDEMLAASVAQHEQLKGTALEGAARRNVAFFAVGARLLNPRATVPAAVQPQVEAELALVDAHAGPAPSPIFGYVEDYSQYVPRGHYTRSDQLKAYFRASMWYGRLTFLANPKSADALDQTRSALLMVSALTTAGHGSALATWERIYDTTAFFVGTSDDLTCYEYRDLAKKVFGSVDQPSAFADEAKLASFASQAFALRPPEINSMVVGAAADRDAATIGYRFLGQRFVLDAAIFQRLIAREVPGRTLPKGLDIPAALGSAEAYALLEAAGETKHERYDQQMSALRQRIAGLSTPTWTQNLYWSWLHALRPLLQARGEGYPTFMRGQAWVRKDLSSFLGSWTELKHDTVLYAKQSYAERGDGVENAPLGYVEPNPEVYARLAALTRMTRDGLTSRGMLTQPSEDWAGKSSATLLGRLEATLLWLKDVAERELADQPLTEADNRKIEEYGAELERFTLGAADPEDPTAPPGRNYVESLNAAVVADVSTDAGGGRVLEEGTGRVFSIYVVVPVGGRLQVNKGGVFSYYEFVEPLANRLTDEAWRARLDRNEAPALPNWTSIYLAPAAKVTPTPRR